MRWRIILTGVVVLATATAGWYWWRTRRIEWYGGVKPFMQKLHALQQQTAVELARSQKLPEDYEQMEQLSQDSHDLIAVFTRWEDPRRQDPRFGSLALELQRQATMLENNWDHGTHEQARASFEALAAACNACHRELAAGKPPGISPLPPGS